MDERISSAVYNPANPYDTSTAMGNQLSSEALRMQTRDEDFRRAVKLFVFQLGILGALAIVFSLFA